MRCGVHTPGDVERDPTVAFRIAEFDAYQPLVILRRKAEGAAAQPSAEIAAGLKPKNGPHQDQPHDERRRRARGQLPGRATAGSAEARAPPRPRPQRTRDARPPDDDAAQGPRRSLRETARGQYIKRLLPRRRRKTRYINERGRVPRRRRFTDRPRQHAQRRGPRERRHAHGPGAIQEARPEEEDDDEEEAPAGR